MLWSAPEHAIFYVKKFKNFLGGPLPRTIPPAGGGHPGGLQLNSAGTAYERHSDTITRLDRESPDQRLYPAGPHACEIRLIQ